MTSAARDRHAGGAAEPFSEIQHNLRARKNDADAFGAMDNSTSLQFPHSKDIRLTRGFGGKRHPFPPTAQMIGTLYHGTDGSLRLVMYFLAIQLLTDELDDFVDEDL
jgi:hypothetical protein